MRKLWRWVVYTGIWASPLILCLGAWILMQIHPKETITPQEWGVLILLASVCVIYIWSTNATHKANGKADKDISVLDAFHYSPTVYDASDGKEKFVYPDIDARMLFDSPFECFYTIGTTRVSGQRKYVGVPFDAPGAKHLLITGGSGSGKSSTQILNFLFGMERYNATHSTQMHALVLDAKGEQWRTVGSKNGVDIALNLNDRQQGYGFNPFYMLSDNPTEQELYELAYTVTISLVPKPGPKMHDTGPWIALAQDMLLGFIIYSYRYKGFRYLPQMVQYMMSRPMEELLEEACNEAEPSSNAYIHLIQFMGMSAETLYSVTATLFPKVKPYAIDQNLVWGMKNCPRMFRWEDLRSRSAYIVMPLDKIAQYGQLIFLLINMFSLWLFHLPEKTQEPERAELVLVLDETTAIFQALGSVPDQYPQLLRYGRSFGFNCITAVQSLAGLKTILDDATFEDLISNQPYKVFLDCATEAKMLIDWVGKYKRRMTTFQGIGKDRTQSVQFSDDDILTPAEAQKLGLSDELICISALSGYSRMKKNPWYKDPNYNHMLRE